MENSNDKSQEGLGTIVVSGASMVTSEIGLVNAISRNDATISGSTMTSNNNLTMSGDINI